MEKNSKSPSFALSERYDVKFFEIHSSSLLKLTFFFSWVIWIGKNRIASIKGQQIVLKLQIQWRNLKIIGDLFTLQIKCKSFSVIFFFTKALLQSVTSHSLKKAEINTEDHCLKDFLCTFVCMHKFNNFISLQWLSNSLFFPFLHLNTDVSAYGFKKNICCYFNLVTTARLTWLWENEGVSLWNSILSTEYDLNVISSDV